MIRLAVIGARSSRQGIGGHLARFAARAGGRLIAVAGTSEATAAEAAAALATVAHPPPRAYADATAMLREESLDALVIASPHDTHEGYLRAALDLGLHVLCEKPLCWGGLDAAAAARTLAEGFLARGLHLTVNVQWPYTLSTYRELHPRALSDPPATFHMLLSPRSSGLSMIPDAVPHALSLLAAAVPDADATVEAVKVRTPDLDGRSLEATFQYRARGETVRARVEMRTCERQPRPAAYGFDGLEAARTVELPGYRLSLESGGRRIPLPDPTPLLVGDFLRRVSSGVPATIDPAAVPGMRNLETIWKVANGL